MQDVALRLESVRDDQRDKYWHHLQGRVAMGAAEVRGARSLMGDRPFVREVVGLRRDGSEERRNVPGKKCYLDANAVGSRGVYYWYTLRQGGCYFVQEQPSRYRARRYYLIVLNGVAGEVSREAARAYVGSSVVIE